MATEAVAMPAHAESDSGPRWLLAIAGVLWILVALVVLSADATSAATIGYHGRVRADLRRSR